MSAPLYVDTAPELAAFASAVRQEAGARVGVDTEAASFHRYRDRIYLVQVSSPTQTALIDPVAIGDLTPIGTLLADSRLEKTFHDADYDLRVLDRPGGGNFSLRPAMTSPSSPPAIQPNAGRRGRKANGVPACRTG